MSNPMSDDRPPTVHDYVTRDQIEDLWGIGFTIVARSRHSDPFHVPQEMVPHGRRYQWWHLVHDRMHFERPKHANPSGWAPVPASRHDGYFMPFGHRGDIEVSGLGLFEKSAFEVQQELNANAAAAQQQVTDWAKQAGAEGLSGSFSIGGVETVIGSQPKAQFKRDDTKTIETTVAMPKDMLPHTAKVFAERDRLYRDLVFHWNSGNPLTDQQEMFRAKYEDAFAANPNILKGPTLNAIVLPVAIDNVRSMLKSQENTDE